jgi:hypothetical protein
MPITKKHKNKKINKKKLLSKKKRLNKKKIKTGGSNQTLASIKCIFCGAIGKTEIDCPYNSIVKNPGKGHNPIPLENINIQNLVDTVDYVWDNKTNYDLWNKLIENGGEYYTKTLNIDVFNNKLPCIVSYDDQENCINIEIGIPLSSFKLFGSCWRIKIYLVGEPNIKFSKSNLVSAADGLLYATDIETRSKRISISSKACFGNDISGRWLLAIRDLINIKLGIKYCIMGDESIFYEGSDEFDLRMLMIQKYNKTYYMRYGYEPIIAPTIFKTIDAFVLNKNIKVLEPFKYQELFSEIKQLPKYTKDTRFEWRDNTKRFSDLIPKVYVKNYTDYINRLKLPFFDIM